MSNVTDTVPIADLYREQLEMTRARLSQAERDNAELREELARLMALIVRMKEEQAAWGAD